MYKIEVSTQEERDETIAEITQKVAAYKAAQQHQLKNGGPGPVASYEVMAIANEHNGEFEVVVVEPEPIVIPEPPQIEPKAEPGDE